MAIPETIDKCRRWRIHNVNYYAYMMNYVSKDALYYYVFDWHGYAVLAVPNSSIKATAPGLASIQNFLAEHQKLRSKYKDSVNRLATKSNKTWLNILKYDISPFLPIGCSMRNHKFFVITSLYLDLLFYEYTELEEFFSEIKSSAPKD